MSQLNYFPHPAANRPPHRTGLTVWGVVLIVLGSLFVFFALISVVAVPVMRTVNGAPAGSTPRLVATLASTVATTGALGGGLIWLGVGSCRGRRWVRPIVVAGGCLMMAYGLTSLIHVTANLARAVTSPPPPAAAGPFPAKAMLVSGAVMALVMEVGLGLALPAALVWYYGRRSVADTLAVTDPLPRWTDRVPLPLLGWVLACAHSGGVLVLIAAAGTWVAFTAVLDGWPATVALLVTGGLLLAAAYGSFRRSRLAHVLGVVVYLLLAASTFTFAATGDTTGYYRRIVQGMVATTAGPSAQNTAMAQAQAANGPALWVGSGTLYMLLGAFGTWVAWTYRPNGTNAGPEPRKGGTDAA